ncbi:MAG: GLPGLI family protein [Bacteroidales bacterium]|nr:GLPGLI family protein [Bacteroidales bacterium]MBN2756464.1 GLPGLI family protein [Bacteroidales bacterium]
MEKSKLILFLILSFNYQIIAQVNSTRAFYGKSIIARAIDNNDDQALKEALAFTYKNLTENMKDVEYELIFNKNESFFKAVEKLEMNNNYNLAVIWEEGGALVYTNRKEIIKQKEEEDKLYLIYSCVEDYNWKLEKETKQIGKYLCYKATTIKKMKNSKGEFKKLVEAWYAPEIPFSFGPAGYVGLPGLILELKIADITLFLTKLEFNPKKKVSIKKLEKGKRISEEDYEKMINDNAMNFFFNEN